MFDETEVNEELGAQVEITQSFDVERRKLKTEFNKEEQDLRERAKEAEKAANNTEAQKLKAQADKIQKKSLWLDSISGALYGPNSNGTTGYVAKAVSPQIAFKIGQYFKSTDNTGSAGHLMAHTVLGAAVSYLSGNDAVTGGLSAGVGEAAAPVLSKYLFKTDNPADLTAEQKDTISAITAITGATIGATTGNVTDTVNAVETGKVAVEDNGLLDEVVGGVSGVVVGFSTLGEPIIHPIQTYEGFKSLVTAEDKKLFLQTAIIYDLEQRSDRLDMYSSSGDEFGYSMEVSKNTVEGLTAAVGVIKAPATIASLMNTAKSVGRVTIGKSVYVFNKNTSSLVKSPSNANKIKPSENGVYKPTSVSKLPDNDNTPPIKQTGNCFTAGTVITTKLGHQTIESLKVGKPVSFADLSK